MYDNLRSELHIRNMRVRNRIMLTAMGTERIVAGTNLAGWDQCLDPSHGDGELASIFDTNARRLLRLGGHDSTGSTAPQEER